MICCMEVGLELKATYVRLAESWIVGLMLWFIRKRFVGSYLFFKARRRS